MLLGHKTTTNKQLVTPQDTNVDGLSSYTGLAYKRPAYFILKIVKDSVSSKCTYRRVRLLDLGGSVPSPYSTDKGGPGRSNCPFWLSSAHAWSAVGSNPDTGIGRIVPS